MLSDLTKYHGQGDTPKSNEKRPSDPVSLVPVSIDGVEINASRVGDFSTPGAGNGHLIVTTFDLIDHSSNPGFVQAMDENVRAIRELYKTVLPYTEDKYRRATLACISIYAAMLMVRQKLSMYNWSYDTIPFLHQACIKTISNPDEVGIVNAQKIKFLEKDDIAVTLANYNFMVNRVAQLPIPASVKKLLDWLFGNVFTDSGLISPQFYINEFKVVPLYGIVNGELAPVFDWDLRLGTLDDILKSIEIVISTTNLIVADINRTGLMAKMAIPELKLSIVDKDFEYFNMLINAYSEMVPPSSGNLGDDPLKPDYVRADVIGSMDDSHLQACALGALRKWNEGLLVKICAQSIFIPSANGAVAPQFKVSATGSTINYELAAINQKDDYYISFKNGINMGIYTDRLASGSTETFNADNNNRLPASFVPTAAVLGLTGSVKYLARVDGTIIPIAFTNDANYRYELYLELNAGGNHYLKLLDRVNNTNTTLFTLGPSAPLDITELVRYSDSGYYEIKSTSVLYTAGSAAIVAAFAALMGDDASLFDFDYQVGFTKTTTAVTYTITATNPAIAFSFIEQVDYHIAMGYYYTVRMSEAGTRKIGLRNGQHLIKESYTPVIFNKPDLFSFLRYAVLGLFTSGGKITYAIPRSRGGTKGFKSDAKKRKFSSRNKGFSDEEDKK